MDTNIRGTYNILEACRQHGKLQAVVIASSDKAYGTSEQLPYLENYALKGLHPYDASKSCADILSLTYLNTYHLPIGITRCGNIYGPGDANFDRLIPGTIKWLLDGEDIEVRSDGTYKRDYLYIDDAVSGYLRLAERIVEDSAQFSGAYNFSHGTECSILEVVEWLKEIAEKKDHPTNILNIARSEIEFQLLDSSKAREKLGWQPEVGVIDGLRKSYQWYQNKNSK